MSDLYRILFIYLAATSIFLFGCSETEFSAKNKSTILANTSAFDGSGDGSSGEMSPGNQDGQGNNLPGVGDPVKVEIEKRLHQSLQCFWKSRHG